ncbi:MAG: S24 family peptidase [Bdellovibrionaceae bacterium]|nr:S24 family peptidase [Pseudobdellovibrionaceae bacterium]
MASGLFGISEDHLEKYQSLDERLIRDRAATFFFEASGEAMSPLIMEKDILIVDRSIQPVSGCIVIVQIEGELLCRRLQITDHEVGLYAENSQHTPLILRDEQDLQVFGVVTSVVRDILPRATHVLGPQRKDGFR